MRVLLSTYGSRGDVEPLAGLAVALQALGAEAVVCAPPDQEFAGLLARVGVPLAPAFLAGARVDRGGEAVDGGPAPARGQDDRRAA